MGISGEQETTVNDSGSVTIPKLVRDSADIDAGDKIRWTVDGDGNVSVEVVKERTGAFDDIEPEASGRDDFNSVTDADRVPELE